MTTALETPIVPRPITPGPEMEALTRFFPNVTWDGAIVQGGMGPGSPAMTACGRGTCHWIQEGRWIVGDFEQDQHLLDGTFVLTWELHWVVGWDPAAREYRATFADNYGHAGVMHGRLDGDVLTFETPDDGGGVRQRMVWSLVDAAAMTWRNEISVGGAAFALVEEYTFSVTGELSNPFAAS